MHFLERCTLPGSHRSIVPVLTPREADVIYLLSRGCSYATVAHRLGISVHTVASHIKNAYRKLSVRTAAAAVTRAAELGMLSPIKSGEQA